MSLRFSNCHIADSTVIWHPELVNLYHCTIGEDCMIAAFVEIGANAKLGNRVKVQAHAFIPENVVIEDDVFIGPRVTFTNDRYPPSGVRWKSETPTRVRKGASIGASAVILPGIEIGENAMVGAGAVVINDVPTGACVVGNPARICGERRYYVDS